MLKFLYKVFNIVSIHNLSLSLILVLILVISWKRLIFVPIWSIQVFWAYDFNLRKSNEGQRKGKKLTEKRGHGPQYVNTSHFFVVKKILLQKIKKRVMVTNLSIQVICLYFIKKKHKKGNMVLNLSIPFGHVWKWPKNKKREKLKKGSWSQICQYKSFVCIL